MIPVAGDLIKVALGHQRSLGQQIPAGLLHVLHPALEKLDNARTLRQQNRETLTDAVHRGEVFQLASELVVVTLKRFFLLGEIGVKIFLLRERDSVNSLQHLPLRVAAPVCAAALRQLDGVALDAAGGVEVRAGAEVGEFALTVERDVCIFGQILNQLDLIRLFLLFHKLDGFVARQLKELELQLFLADLAHLGFQFRQHLRREGERRVEVIVEAVVDGRADGQLHLRVQPLDGLRQDVRTGVPVRLAVLFVFKGKFVVFAHDKPPDFSGAKQNTPRPCVLSGVRRDTRSTVPPCLRTKRPSLVRSVTGAPVRPYCVSAFRTAAQKWYFQPSTAKTLAPYGSLSAAGTEENMSFSLPFSTTI